MLNGNQIRLRPVEPEDAALLASWYSDPDYLGTHFNVWPERAIEWQQMIASNRPREREGSYLISLADDPQPIGAIGYFNPYVTDLYQAVEIWYQVHPSSRRQTIATQAACVLVNHLFGAIPMQRIEAATTLSNGPSIRVLKTAGFQEEGIRRRCMFLHGEFVDVKVFSILREEWINEKHYRKGRDF